MEATVLALQEQVQQLALKLSPTLGPAFTPDLSEPFERVLDYNHPPNAPMVPIEFSKDCLTIAQSSLHALYLRKNHVHSLQIYGPVFTIFAIILTSCVDPRTPAGVLFPEGAGTRASLAEHLLTAIAEPYDFLLKEAAFTYDDSDDEDSPTLSPQAAVPGGGGDPHTKLDPSKIAQLLLHAMWTTLTVCWQAVAESTGTKSHCKLDGAAFLELCGNELFMPIALAKLLLPVEPLMARPLAELWVAAHNLEAVKAVVSRLENYSGSASADCSVQDIKEYRKRLCSAFVDEGLLGEITDQARARNAVFSPHGVHGIAQRQQAGAGAIIAELLAAGGICVREMAELFCDTEYQDWASAYPSMWAYSLRHVQLYGKLYAELVLKDDSIAPALFGTGGSGDLASAEESCVGALLSLRKLDLLDETLRETKLKPLLLDAAQSGRDANLSLEQKSKRVLLLWDAAELGRCCSGQFPLDQPPLVELHVKTIKKFCLGWCAARRDGAGLGYWGGVDDRSKAGFKGAGTPLPARDEVAPTFLATRAAALAGGMNSAAYNGGAPPSSSELMTALATAQARPASSAPSAPTRLLGRGTHDLTQAAPPHYLCQIDGRLMTTPVLFTSPGTQAVYRYELETLQRWSAVNGDVCPVSGEAFVAGSVVVEENLKKEIGRWVKAQGG